MKRAGKFFAKDIPKRLDTMRRVTQPETIEEEPLEGPQDVESGEPVPGLLLIFSGNRPQFAAIPLERGAIEFGRGDVGSVRIDDERMSRAHARISLAGRCWTVRDLGSRNGTVVDGDKPTAERSGEMLRFVRTGSTLFVLVRDLRLYQGGVAHDGPVIKGPAMERAFRMTARSARAGRVLHVTGESGTGKELLARWFHDAGPHKAGPFVAVNGATLPGNLAERLLFGSRKGAYSGATDAKGFVQSAHGGTLFLDEVADIELGVQAKLLRVLETGEVVPLGATVPERVNVRFCSATHADLRTRVAEGKMRADLFFRMGTPAVSLPPLRERPEEIPWLIERVVRETAASVDGSNPAASLVAPHVSLVEACLLRHWPGNVRELLSEVRQAVQFAMDEGSSVMSRHLAVRAGAAIEPEPMMSEPVASPPPSVPAARANKRDEEIAEALRASGGNILRAARALGMHRTQLYRWMARQGQKGEVSPGEGEGSQSKS